MTKKKLVERKKYLRNIIMKCASRFNIIINEGDYFYARKIFVYRYGFTKISIAKAIKISSYIMLRKKLLDALDKINKCIYSETQKGYIKWQK